MTRFSLIAHYAAAIGSAENIFDLQNLG